MRGEDARLLFGAGLAAEWKASTNCGVPIMDHKRHFHYDFLERRPFKSTSGADRARIQTSAAVDDNFC